MAGNDFGSQLRQARERKGYDLITAARRLRIRPDILRAIESSDYEKMPPRGYARNMVNAYARFVGLNPTDITRAYLDGAAQYRNANRAGAGAYRAGSGAYGAGTSGGFTMPSGSRRSRADEMEGGRPHGSRASAYSRSSYRRGADAGAGSGRRASEGNRFSRTYDLSDDADDAYGRVSRGSYGRGGASGEARGGRRARGGEESGARGFFSSIEGMAANAFGGGGQRVRRGDGGDSSYYTSIYSDRRNSATQGRLPFIVAGAVILVLLVMVISLLMGNGQSSKDEVPSVPVTGLTDTTASQSGSSAESSDQQTSSEAPTKAVFSYSIPDGAEAYVEIYQDDSESPSTAGTLSGPVDESIDVTGTLTFVTSAPDNVTLQVDGSDVEMTETVSGTGVYEYTVDFASILEQWNSEHGASSSTTDTTDTTSSDTSA